MPRQRRVHLPGGLYHAVLRGNHRCAIFAVSDDCLCFEDILSRALKRCGASLFAYCWMTNHVHLAVRIAEVPLGAVMGIVASRYARAKQRVLATTGHLFERRYRARLIDADRYLLALVRYIHFNPVRARMVAAPGDYRWSSHRPGGVVPPTAIGRWPCHASPAARGGHGRWRPSPPKSHTHTSSRWMICGRSCDAVTWYRRARSSPGVRGAKALRTCRKLPAT